MPPLAVAVAVKESIPRQAAEEAVEEVVVGRLKASVAVAEAQKIAAEAVELVVVKGRET